MTIATILPPARTVFVDANGTPLVGGTVGFFVPPATSTPKTTWQDAAGATPNANPVVLDSAGSALIYGSGSYYMVVKDVNSNLIWNGLSQDVYALIAAGNNTFSGSNTFSGNVSFTGVATAVTQSPGDTSTKIATDAFVSAAVAATSSFKTIHRQTFTATGTFTPTTGMLYCDIEVWGGGGGGGGSSINQGTGAGGGAGGYSRKVVAAATIGVSKAVTIGAGGTAGAAAAGTGGTGGTTSVGAIIQATGGAGGTGCAGTAVTPGAGGVGSLGDINATGAPGGTTIWGGNLANASSSGGNSSLGGAGTSVGTQQVGASAVANSGSGASGGVSSGSAETGGVGGSGFVCITEYCSQ